MYTYCDDLDEAIDYAGDAARAENATFVVVLDGSKFFVCAMRDAAELDALPTIVALAQPSGNMLVSNEPNAEYIASYERSYVGA